MIKFYDTINKLNYKLWKVIKNPAKDKNIENKESYYYNLKKDDILSFGNIKLILREFCTNHINKDNNVIIMVLMIKIKKIRMKILKIIIILLIIIMVKLFIKVKLLKIIQVL